MARKGKLEAPGLMLVANRFLSAWPFRYARLSSRGLLISMAFENHVNGKLPAAPEKLARILAQPEEEVRLGLIEIADFLIYEGEYVEVGDVVVYRQRLAAISNAQSEGGVEGAKRTNEIKQQKKLASREVKQRSGKSSGNSPSTSSSNTSPNTSSEPSGSERVGDDFSTQPQHQHNTNPRLVGSDGEDQGIIDAFADKRNPETKTEHVEESGTSPDDYIKASRGGS